ncbi:MAG TPA: alpha/beta hydrolase [Bacteroidales bacterium]|nr:alpha/beta hydrolase [Bacteroidales bacterium]HRW94467.1 alpha/beta hydrolase [Bacteroidales bacterium]
MKRIIICFTLILVPFVLFSSEKRGDHSEEKEPLCFLRVLKDSIFTFDHIKTSLFRVYPALDTEDLDKLIRIVSFLDTTTNALSTAIAYKTIDPRGDTITASGIIMRPEGRESKGLLFFFPSAKIDKATAASEMMLTFEGFLSYFGYTVIVPDLIGYGISSNTEYPFLFAENTGRVAYDMYVASEEYLSAAGITIPKDMTIGGYSMGGMGTVALHRFIEENDTTGLIVNASYPAGGVYDLGMALDVLTTIKHCNFPFVPYMCISMDYWYNLGVDYSQVFIDPLLSNMDDWLARKYLPDELRKRIPSDMTAYLHPDFFTDIKNESVRKIDSCSRFHSVIEGWVPKAPMIILHSVDDDMAPYRVAEHMFKTFLNKGGNVTLISGKLDHMTYGIEYYLKIIFYHILK